MRIYTWQGINVDLIKFSSFTNDVPRPKVSRPRNNTSIIATSRKTHRWAGILIGKISILALLHRQMTISKIKRKRETCYYFTISNHFHPFFSFRINVTNYYISLRTIIAWKHWKHNCTVQPSIWIRSITLKQFSIVSANLDEKQ